MAGTAAHCPGSLPHFALSVVPEKVLQRNYITVVSLLHERIKQHQEANALLEQERAVVQQLQHDLATLNARASEAEAKIQHFAELEQEALVLRTELSALTTARQSTEQKCSALQEQISRVKQDFYAAMSAKQSATQLLQDREQQLSALTTAHSTCEQQLDVLQSDNQTLSSKLASCQDRCQQSQAALQVSEHTLATSKIKLQKAEDALTAQMTVNSQLQQQLAAAEVNLESTTASLRQVNTAHLSLLEDTKQWQETSAQKEAAYADAAAQIDSLQAQLAAACDRAEKAERQQHAAVAASQVALNRAQHELQDARAAQYVAEEAHKTADAAARLLAQKITEIQKEAAQHRGVGDAAKEVMRDQLGGLLQQLELQKQKFQAWQFRQLEFLTRLVNKVESLEARLNETMPLSTLPATALICPDKLHGLTVGIDEGLVALGSLVASCSKISSHITAWTKSPRAAQHNVNVH